MIAASIAAAALVAFAGDEPKCNGAIRDCDQQIRKMLGGRRFFGATVDNRNPGLFVRSVIPNSPAARADLRSGDRLIAINGRSLTHASVREFKQVLADARETGKLWIIISRRNVYMKLDAKLEPYTKEQMQKIIDVHLSQSHTTTAGKQ
ncbi:MAG TPA: PDZ domain-containing protein [Thermoanaerobaculia bacterium]|nr:PDZ domain-containing protein [Thermoanaerobaculia bacterium]